MHYNFQLELHDVLRSWAMPMGPSLNPADKRLAVEVEDHPVEYADFEGIIPEGNYGAGEVIVWDKGLWVPLENPEETLPLGKLTFELRGYKLRGAWHLFRTKGLGKQAGAGLQEIRAIRERVPVSDHVSFPSCRFRPPPRACPIPRRWYPLPASARLVGGSSAP